MTSRNFNSRPCVHSGHDRLDGAVYCANNCVCQSEPEDALSRPAA